jgi:Peptidase family M23
MTLLAAILCLLFFGGCDGSSSAKEPVSESMNEPAATQKLTPLLLALPTPPVPFKGSDGNMHLVYELWLTDFSSGNADIKKVDIIGDGVPLATLAADRIDRKLLPAGSRQPGGGTMAPGTQALLFVHLILPPGSAVPHVLRHEALAHLDAAPPGHQELTALLDGSPVDSHPVTIIGPPLRGDHYLSADSCCDAARHTQAALAVNGRVWVAQRFAVDWEQLDNQNRIYSGPRDNLSSYTIYGKPVYAVADGKVVTAINDQLDQPPGRFPTGLTLEQADGNAIIEDLGGGVWALYAHMQKGSLRVGRGDQLVRGQVIGLAGNSGNTIAPHLHFQVQNRPLSLAADGLPYEIDAYRITGLSPGTKAFDEAEANGTPLAVTPASPAQLVSGALPLDQLIISFP